MTEIKRANDMVDIDRAPDAIKAALYNSTKYDMLAFDVWILVQPDKLVRSARMCPPNRLYELQTQVVYVEGYGKDGRVVCRLVMDPTYARIHCHPDELVDITNDLRSKYGLVD